MEIEKIRENTYQIPKTGDMNAPVKIYANEQLLEKIREDDTLQQITNVAQLPSIQKHAVVMPDGHQGYGMPVGGVAAFKNIISPGAIGFDVNCGIRVLKTNLDAEDLNGKEEQIANILYNKVPTGTGKGGYINLSREDLDQILEKGLQWMYENGHATKQDLESCEDQGQLPGKPGKVSEEAKNRGYKQLGSLGSGNHFLEIQTVEQLFDEEKADKFGLRENQVLIMIHSGSRGLGHQVCKDYVQKFKDKNPEIQEKIPDDNLMYAPIDSKEGQNYKHAMYAAANFAYANRQAMTQAVRKSLSEIYEEKELETELLYDVCHNIAKEEKHQVNGEQKEVIVHRKGSTRAFPPGRKELPEKYQETGQPVLLPGTMGTNSYILSGGQKSLELSFGSTAHGAGRLKSRTEGRNTYQAERIQKKLKNQGITVKANSPRTLEEETPGSYKNVDQVVQVSDQLNIGRKVAKLQPRINIKG